MIGPRNNDPTLPWVLARTFVLIYLAFSLLLLGIAAAHFYTQYQAARVSREAAERVSVALARRAVLGDIAGVVTDLTVLARQLEDQLDIQGGGPLEGRLGRIFAIFVVQKGLYDQIRYIDARGMEQVRINRSGGGAQAAEALQDKSGRYYFREAMALPAGGIYLSPLDLNMEQGRIERPLKPMLRFAAPVFDGAGQRRGILVLNYLGQRLLDNFREAAAHVADHIHLTEHRGYWLTGPRPEDAWGFMLGHQRTFAERFPEEWRTIQGGAEGQFATPAGLFTFTTVSLLPAAAAASRSGFDMAAWPAHKGSGGREWKIIAHLPPQHLGGTPGRFFAQNSTLYLSLLALLALGSWLLARARVYHRLAEVQSEYERRFRHTLEDIELAAVTLDRRGRVSFCNRYFQRLTGWERDQVVGQDWVARFVPEEGRESMRGALERLGESQQFPARLEAEVQTRDGERRLLAWHNSLSRNPLGEALSVTSIGEDITEKRRGELELTKLHRAVEQSPSVVVITDSRGLIEYVNPKFSEVTGYRLDEVAGKNPSILKSGDTSEGEYGNLWRTITTGGVWHGEFHNQRKNGELYWESAAISAVRDAAGRITHYLAVKEDITERKRLEQEVEQRNRELARSQVLAQMGRMASMIAHDLRNPLSSVKMTLQVLRKQGAGTAEAAELTRISLDQVAYMEAIINDMLTYSRPQQLHPEWLDAGKLLDTAIGLARRKIEEQRVRIETDYQHGLPTFPGDPNQLRQVFSNLIVNGVQAMAQTAREERVLRISACVDFASAGTAVRVEICDRGCGLGKESEDKLFEPFYTTRAKGTGLGLAIVRQILQRHNGDIRLLPRDGGGVCARVTLPTVPAQQASGILIPQNLVAETP
jgi:PAS domain S-box-containing protein